jgi:hypothetical protein
LTYVVSFDLCGFLLLTLSFPCGKWLEKIKVYKVAHIYT